jgi:hypothetical protein
MRRLFVLLVILSLGAGITAQQIGTITAEESGEGEILIKYSILQASGSDKFYVKVYCSTNGGTTWGKALTAVSGDVGQNVYGGYSRQIRWNVLGEKDKLVGDNIRFKIVASPVSSTSYNKSRITRVEGKVTDRKGDPLPGANIVIKGTYTGTVSDIQGYYELQIPEGATTIEYSYLGYEKVDRAIVDDKIDVTMVETIWSYSRLTVRYRGGIRYTRFGMEVDFRPGRFINDLYASYSTDFYYHYNFSGLISTGFFLLRPVQLAFTSDLIAAGGMDMQNYGGKLSVNILNRSAVNANVDGGAGYAYLIREGPDFSTVSYYGGLILNHQLLKGWLTWSADCNFMYYYALIRMGITYRYRKISIGAEYDLLDSYSELLLKAGYTFTFK